jgi:hypothetical protein
LITPPRLSAGIILAMALSLASWSGAMALGEDKSGQPPTPPPPTESTANAGKTVIVTQVQPQTEPALGGAIDAQPRCAWTEIVPYLDFGSDGRILPYEVIPGSGIFLRAWNNCTPYPSVLLDASPEETADAVWAQTIAEIPTAVFELYPPIEWHATVNVPNWVYAGANIKPFTHTGGFAQNQINIRVIPRAMNVDWGDETIQTCASLGVPYIPAEHPSLLIEQARETIAPNACAHSYKRHSGKQAGGAYPLTMSIVWDASWTSSSGESGAFAPYTQATTVAMKVDQIQIIGGKAPTP